MAFSADQLLEKVNTYLATMPYVREPKGLYAPIAVSYTHLLKLRKKPRRREFSVGEYVEGIVKGDVTVLSQAVTLVELSLIHI